MPEIFQYLNYIIRFFTNEHLPVHVHVQLQKKEVKAEFKISEDIVTLTFKKVKGKIPLKEAEVREVSVFLKAYHKQIIDKWETAFIYHKKVKFDIIKKRLKRKA